eukprot:SAG11_NODE_4417_length_1904_cov_23.385042_2_plen_127_part_00
MLVAFYCDERQWLGSGCDGDAWPAVDIVQRIAVASPALYFSDLRCLTYLTSHRYCFRLGEYSGLEPRPVTVQELRRFDQSYDRRFLSSWRLGWQASSGGRSDAQGVEDGAMAESRHEEGRRGDGGA